MTAISNTDLEPVTVSDRGGAAKSPPPTPFSVTCEVEREVLMVAVSGELDLSNASELTERLHAAKSRRAIVDFSACDFIDSTGIALLVNALRDANESGGLIALCGLRDQVRRVLEIAGVEDRIPTEPGREEALAAVLGR